ncbi:low molecular weight protein-tyrosine-phosphatase [Marinimicrobium alkaliphilum]|uniref:low molecular weight protein-tyrosine-phosphatase n=1 Tax=Marinimicrobium alkaliphilum TaxID=2202654 RepID=UPI000DBA803D|nr:low molecular weight protein-tyrosine-phosphatase [Marinimicrobium alkaliphilum]
MSVKVLFVCLGNICRSPTAHGVFQALVQRESMGERITIDSAGTGDWHVGKAPDRRAQQAAAERGYDLSGLRARQVARPDFDHYDYVLAMDNSNLSDLKRLAPSHFKGHLGLFLDFARRSAAREVPDPYYGGDEGFAEVLDMVEDAAEGLLDDIRQRLV